MAEIKDLSTTDASNTARFPENQAPSTVNNGARALEGMIARADRDNDGSLTTGGTSTAYTVTLNSQHSAWFTGLKFRAKLDQTCGATPTINPTGSAALGAKSLYTTAGAAVASGALIGGGMYDFVYDGTNVQVVNADGFTNPLTTRGDIIYQGASSPSRLAVGTSAQALKGGTDPSWGSVDGTMIRMGSDAQGDVYYFDGTNVVRLAAGTSGYYLKTQGAGANPTWAAVTTGLVPIERITTSSAATYDFQTGISSTYRSYRLVGWLQPATDDVEFWIRFSDDGGSTYEADAGDYSYRGFLNDDGGTNRGGNSNSDTKIKPMNADASLAVGNAADEFIQFDLMFSDPSGGTKGMAVQGMVAYVASTGVHVGGIFSGRIKATANIEGIRLMFESGNIATGDATLYGIANS